MDTCARLSQRLRFCVGQQKKLKLEKKLEPDMMEVLESLIDLFPTGSEVKLFSNDESSF